MPRPLPFRPDPAPPAPGLQPGDGQAAHDAARDAQFVRLRQVEHDTEEPRSHGAELADQMTDTTRALIRHTIGPAPWVQGAWPSRVLSIEDRTRRRCTVQLLESGGVIDNVQADPTNPTIGGQYAVRRTVRLNPAATRGAPEEVHWTLKVLGGRFLYGAEGDLNRGWAVWRVPFPLPDSPDAMDNTPTAGVAPNAPELVVARLGFFQQVQWLAADDYGHLYADISEEVDPETLHEPDRVHTYDVSGDLPAPQIAVTPDLATYVDYTTDVLRFVPDVSPPHPFVETVAHSHVLVIPVVRAIVGTAYPSPLWVASSGYPATQTVVIDTDAGTITVTAHNREAVWYSLDQGATWTLWYLYDADTSTSTYPDYLAAPDLFTTAQTYQAGPAAAFGWVEPPAVDAPENTPGALHIAEVHPLFDGVLNHVTGYVGHVGGLGGPVGGTTLFDAFVWAWSRRAGPQAGTPVGIAFDPEVVNILRGSTPPFTQTTDGGATWTTPDIRGAETQTVDPDNVNGGWFFQRPATIGSTGG